MAQNQALNKRKVTPIERLFRWSPYSIVTMVARIKGEVSPEMLAAAVDKVLQRHWALQVRIVEDAGGSPWFTPERTGEIPIQVVPRESDDGWIRVQQAACRVPFEFDARPAIRFLLVQGPNLSELIILCHHILCDGLSLAYLARDLMVHLGDPDCESEVLPAPVPMDQDTLPPGISLNPVVRFFINRLNKRWAGERVSFDQADYEALHRAYWDHYDHDMVSIELSAPQTAALVARCREHGVTVNSALSAAFAGAQHLVLGNPAYHPRVGVAASVRDRLPALPGEAMGFYAGLVTPKYAYRERAGFWENAQRFHRQVTPMFNDQNLLSPFSLWCALDPSILEAMHFKMLGGLATAGKLASFSGREDVVLSLLRRDRRESPDQTYMGTAITNLGRLDFPAQYGSLELERLIMQPGGGFPLAQVNLVLGAVTCAGRLSLVVEYAPQAVDAGTVAEIQGRAMAFLLTAS